MVTVVEEPESAGCRCWTVSSPRWSTCQEMSAFLLYWSRRQNTSVPEVIEQRTSVLLGESSLVVAWKISREWAGSYGYGVLQLTCVVQTGKLQAPLITIGRTSKDWVASCKPAADARSATVPPVTPFTWNRAGWVPGPRC